MEKKQTKPTFTIPMAGYTANLEEGKWNYEPTNEIEKGSPGKKLVAKYRDPVQFKVMEGYEQIAKSRFQKQIGGMVMDVVSFLSGI